MSVLKSKISTKMTTMEELNINQDINLMSKSVTKCFLKEI